MLLGVGVNLASARFGTPVLVGTLFVCLALAIKGLDAIVPGPPSLVIAAGLTYGVEHFVPGGTAGTAGWLGTAVALGMVVHSVGDAITESGAPLLWPLPIRKRRWYPVGQPASAAVPHRRRGRGVAGGTRAHRGRVPAGRVRGAGVAPWLLEMRAEVERLLAGG